MRNKLPALLTLLVGVTVNQAAAQDLVIVRSRKDVASQNFGPALNQRIARGQLVVPHSGAGAGDRLDPYQMVIVYPQTQPQRSEQNLTGKDASGTLTFNGYPVTPAGRISAKVEPADAEFFIDGRPINVDPRSGLSAKIGYLVGSHVLEARKPGFQPYFGQVNLRANNDAHIDIKLIKSVK